jgi:curved DNA-binding protein CbpA
MLLLKVKPGVTAAQLKQAYHEGAKKYHPDTASGSDEMFKQLTQAYIVLKALPIPSKEPEADVPVTWENYANPGYVRPQHVSRPKEAPVDGRRQEQPASQKLFFEGFVYATGAVLVVSVCYFKLTADASLKEFFEERERRAVEVEEQSLAGKDFKQRQLIKY